MADARLPPTARARAWLPALAAAGVFALLLLRPAYIGALRSRMRADDPRGWAALSTNGRFRLLVPQLVSLRYHDEAFYAGCAREVLTHGRPYDHFWRGGVGSWIQDSINLFVLAAVALPFGGDMNRAWIASVALLGAAWFLLFYRVFHWWSGKEEVALPLALFSILFPDLYTWLLDVNFNLQVNLDRYSHVFFQRFSEVRPHFYRLPSGFLSEFLMCLLFLGAWSLGASPRRRPAGAVLLGLAFGLMAWAHPFEFVFGMATLLVLTAAVWLRPSRPERRWNVSLAFAAALPAAVFCAGVVARSVPAQAWKDHLELTGAVFTRRPFLITLIHPLFALFGARVMRGEPDPRRRDAWLLLICAQLGIFLCRNAQVVLGYYVQPFHYIPLGSFMGCLMLFLYAAQRLASARGWSRAAGFSLSAVLFAWGLANEKAGAEATYRLFGLPRAAETALDWTRDNVPPGALVLSISMMTNESLPLYTRAQGYVSTLQLFKAPFTEADYFEKVARLLKTFRVDPARFLAARWLLPGERARLSARLDHEERALGVVDLEKLEPVEWFFSFNRDYANDASVLRRRAELTRLVEKAEPLPGPYYLWVNADDAPLLRETPSSRGGERVYSGDGVEIYRFAGDSGGSHG
jgi:hypothetical protein